MFNHMMFCPACFALMSISVMTLVGRVIGVPVLSDWGGEPPLSIPGAVNCLLAGYCLLVLSKVHCWGKGLRNG